jgi:CHAD domain-containing protein
MPTLTPFLLVHRHLDTVLAELPGAFDGDVEGVHRARIGTRRLREVLPLVLPSGRRQAKAKADDPSRIARRVRDAGRHLGRVRELDVIDAMLDRAGQRMASTADVVAAARRTLRERQHDERRAMVKAIERLKLDGVGDVVDKSRSVWTRTPLRLLRGSNWVDLMWARIAARGAEADEAVRRAPGVYLPKRAHNARIAVKKLRYAVEVALDTGVWPAERLLKDLRRIQGTLGDVHDAQVVVDSLDDLLGHDASSTEAATLKALFEDDIARAHAEYARRRERLFTIAAVCARAATRAIASGRQRRALVAASLVTAPLLLAARHSGDR